MPDWLDPSVPLLPKLLKQAGYKTAHYGKWHLSGGGVDSPPATSEYGYDDSAVYVGPGPHVFAETSYGKLASEAAAHDEVAACYLTTAAVDHTLRFIRSCGEEPFYINLWLHETHHLVAATEDDKQAYPDTLEPQRTYYSAVTRADRQIGRVLELLDELGKRDHTIVIFSSDNGPEVTHPNPGDKFYYSVGSTGGLRGRKRSLYLGGVGTPLIVRWPGQVPPVASTPKPFSRASTSSRRFLLPPIWHRQAAMCRTEKTCSKHFAESSAIAGNLFSGSGEAITPRRPTGPCGACVRAAGAC
jgi:N-acetylgalactosamine-6-sulfatase